MKNLYGKFFQLLPRVDALPKFYVAHPKGFNLHVIRQQHWSVMTLLMFRIAAVPFSPQFVSW
jgi:hypothetical protein